MAKRLHRWVAVAAIPVMVAELLFPMVAGSTSAKLTVVLLGLSVFVNAPIGVGMCWSAHAGVFGLYLLAALSRTDFVLSSFFVADLQVGLQGLLLSAVVAPLVSDSEERRRFFHDVGVALVAVGTIGAIAGVLKLYLQTRGVMIAALEWEGMYPRGTSLRIDYNVFAIGLVVSLTAAIAVRSSMLASLWQRALATAAIPLLFFTVSFTSSRRGVLFLALALPLTVVAIPGAKAKLRALRVPLVSLAAAGALFVALLLNGDAPSLLKVSEYLDLARAAERVLAVSEAGQLFETRAPLVSDAWNQVSRDAGAVETVIGRGDGYLREMGRVFNREVDYEYPHNLVLSALLHGGVVLAAVMVLGIGVAGTGAWRNRHLDGWVFAALTFAVAFSLTSASSIYSFDILVTLVMIASLAGGVSSGSPNVAEMRLRGAHL